MEPNLPQGPWGPPPSPSPKRRGWVLPVVGGGLAGTLLGLGLWAALSPGDDDSDSGDPGPVPSSSTTSTTAAPAEPTSLTGTWSGTYECVEGQRELVLTMVDIEGQVDAFFEFGGEADPPAGAFTMTGTNDGGQLTLDAGEWIEQPEDYLPVDLLGEVAGDDGEALAGTVEAEGCTTFSVERQTADPWFAAEWEGAYDCGQGFTGLSMIIEAVDGGEPGAVTATFGFFAAPQNPDVPSGSYLMEGQYADGRLALEGVEWVERPDNYEMVGIESDPDVLLRPNVFGGRVTNSSCTAFVLQRAT